MMKFKQLLSEIQRLSEEASTDTPYIVGGVPRDVVLKKNVEFNDFDITTGSEDVAELAKLFANSVGSYAKKLRGGNYQVMVDGMKFDFSSNFMYKNVDDLLTKAGVDDIDNLVRETYSRDFTINTMLMTLDMKGIIDLTKRGFGDIRDGILDCPLDCDESFKSRPNRILRAFYYKAKYGFKFSDGVDAAITRNTTTLSEIHPRYAGEMLNSILKQDPAMIHELVERGILHKLPLTKLVTKVLLENRRILDVI